MKTQTQRYAKPQWQVISERLVEQARLDVQKRRRISREKVEALRVKKEQP